MSVRHVQNTENIKKWKNHTYSSVAVVKSHNSVPWVFSKLYLSAPT